MAIFNSLGSNYNLQYVLRSLFSDTGGQSQKLKSFLQEKYEGIAILTYKGREALTLVLKILNLPKESCVAINGFVCYAVYKAIETAGYKPLCLDLDEKNSDLNFSPRVLGGELEGNKNIKVVVVQNTLGYPCDIEKILKICKEKNLILIEDLAHCVGTKYQGGKETGTIGDFITFSFSQDKIVDAVSGGALVIKNKKYNSLQPKVRLALASIRHALRRSGAKRADPPLAETIQQFNNVGNYQQFKDRLYPLFTFKIRKSYDLVLGKIYHYILKNLNLLSRPMQEGLYNFYSLPNWYCNLALQEFKNLSVQLNYRKEIAEIYTKNLNKKILQNRITNKINLSTNLRFPIFVENRGKLVKFLKKQQIFVSDIWYDRVAPECANAVAISKKILNLPTHINIAREDALRIAEKINVWLKSQ